MRNFKNRKRRAFLLALLLIASIFLGSVANAGAVRAATGGYYIKINKGTNVVTVYESDGTPYTAFTCSTGYATPTGTFYTMAKYRWWELDGPCWGQYCTRITGSILFHSVWYYQNQTPSSQSYAQYNKLGTTASHGCCRLTVAASKWIYDNCPTGTKVIIFNGSSKDDPLGKPQTIKVSGYMGWDPTDPDSANPYKTRSTTPTITVSKKTLAYGSSFGDGYMTCTDSGGFDITDWVKMSGTVNTKKVGSYPVTYSVIDSFGRTASKTVTYKVVDNKAATLTGVKENLTKEYGSTRNMLVGLKAKDSAGVSLTNKISVYIKAPKSDSYVKCTNTSYTFNMVGKYKVKYKVKNPNNGKTTTKTQTIVVSDTKAPVLTSEDNWEEIGLEPSTDEETLFWDDLMEGVTAKLRCGTDVTDEMTIKITSPSGKSETIVESQTYTFSESGTYKLVYTATNPTQNAKGAYASVKKTRYLTVKDRVQTDDGQTEDGQAEVILDE